MYITHHSIDNIAQPIVSKISIGTQKPQVCNWGGIPFVLSSVPIAPVTTITIFAAAIDSSIEVVVSAFARIFVRGRRRRRRH